MKSSRQRSFAKNGDGVVTSTKYRYALIVDADETRIFYIPLRTSSGKGLQSVPKSDRVKNLLVHMNSPEGSSQENQSPHGPIVTLNGSPCSIKDKAYIDATEIYPFQPTEDTKIVGLICTKDLERVIELRNCLRDHTLPKECLHFDIDAMQEYFQSTWDRREVPLARPFDDFKLPPGYPEDRHRPRGDLHLNDNARTPGATKRGSYYDYDSPTLSGSFRERQQRDSRTDSRSMGP